MQLEIEDMFSQLPIEIVLYIISFLDQNAQAQLKQTNHFFKNIFDMHYSNNIFIPAINMEIVKLGYRVPHITHALIGIKSIDEQANLLNLLRKHNAARETFDVIKTLDSHGKSTPELRQVILSYQQNLEGILKFPKKVEDITDTVVGEKTKINFLETSINKLKHENLTSTSTPIYNPILLRMYTETLRMMALIIPPNQVSYLYKQIFLTSFLLANIGDPTGYFCLADVVAKKEEQGKKEEIEYIKNFFQIKTNSNFFVELGIKAFLLHGLSFTQDQSTFLLAFNYTLAFFYPNTTIKLINRLINDYSKFDLPHVLILFKHIPLLLFQCFVNHLDIIYEKVFSKLTDNILQEAGDNLKLIEGAFNNKRKRESQEILLALANQPHLFSHLTLNEILQTPHELCPILRNYHIYDIKNWNQEYANFLVLNLQRLKRVAPVLKYWCGENIVELLSSEEKFFEIIASCKHHEIFFKRFMLVDLKLLFSCCPFNNDTSLLEIFSERDNFLILNALLERANKVSTLISTVERNDLIKNILKKKNINLLFKNFPAFYHQMRDDKVIVENSLNVMMSVINNEEFFLLVLKLTQGQFTVLEKNQHLLCLLKNPIVYRYVDKWEITFDDINEDMRLFYLLKDAKENIHNSLLNLSPKKLKELNKKNILEEILSISSHTLFAWLLFKDIKATYNKKTDTTLSIRKTNEISQLLNNQIIEHLDNFGVYLHATLTTTFKHCDFKIINNFSHKDLLELSSKSFYESNLLEYICNLHPCLVSIAIEKAKNQQKVNIDKFINFFSSPLIPYLTSSFGWLLLIYFKEEFLKEILDMQVEGKLLLEVLMGEDNKNIFYQLLNHCKLGNLIKENPIQDIEQIPITYEVNSAIFLKLLIALAETGFIFLPEKCKLLLNKFSANEILSMNILPGIIKGRSLLQFLGHLAYANQLNTFLDGNIQNVNDVSDNSNDWKTLADQECKTFSVTAVCKKEEKTKTHKRLASEELTENAKSIKRPRTEADDSNQYSPK